MASAVKRCSVAAVLLLAAALPDFRLMKTSQEGLALITNLEGCRLRAYQCSAGVWTNGVGHTVGVRPGQIINQKIAAGNLLADVLATERQIDKCLPVQMPQPVYDAVISFAVNVGAGAACRSTLGQFIRRGQWVDACGQLPRWVFVNGVIIRGLANRRAREYAHCMKGVL